MLPVLSNATTGSAAAFVPATNTNALPATGGVTIGLPRIFATPVRVLTHLTLVTLTLIGPELAEFPTLSRAVTVTEMTPSPLSSVLLGVRAEPLVRVAVEGVNAN